MASLRSSTYSAQATRLRHAINHSTCSTPSPFRCSDYMTTPIIYCYIFRPPGKWFWTILHATSSLPARWTPLVERKPDSKESGILGPTHTIYGKMTNTSKASTRRITRLLDFSLSFTCFLTVDLSSSRWKAKHRHHLILLIKGEEMR